MIFGNDGALYGTTGFGGSVENNPAGTGLGTLFRITTNGVFTSLILFNGTNGSNPQSSLALGAGGNLYGVAADGGLGGAGTIFRVLLAPSFRGIAKLSDGNVLLTGNGFAGSSYRLWSASGLSSPSNFSTLVTSNVFDVNGTFAYTDFTATNSAARFYRISVP
jgi:uncharacterized repeat protein (TIGR03803 family)